MLRREAHAACCNRGEVACCGTAAGGAAAALAVNSFAPADIREHVRDRYAAAARLAATEAYTRACCTGDMTTPTGRHEVFGGALYETTEADGATDGAVQASLGCGVPTAVADLHPGETVLDLGSGAGADVLISARRVGADRQGDRPRHDRRDARARPRQRREAGVDNVEFVKGYIEDIPLPDARVDVVISNCVINLAADKSRCSPRPRACCAPAAASPSPTSSPTPTWTRPPVPTCSSGPAASPAR